MRRVIIAVVGITVSQKMTKEELNVANLRGNFGGHQLHEDPARLPTHNVNVYHFIYIHFICIQIKLYNTRSTNNKHTLA